MNQNIDYQKIIEDAIKETTKGVGALNILIAGKTGTGKSTLINSIFRGNLAETGIGRPITQKIEEISQKGHPLTIIDTKGLELKDFQSILDDLQEEIEKRGKSEDPDKHIHAAWVCIQSTSSRIESAEIELCEFLLAQKIPTIVVITKSKKIDPFIKIVRNHIPSAKYVTGVRAIPEYIEEMEQTLPVLGLDELIEATAKILPEAQARAYTNALNTKHKRALTEKKNRAEIEVNIAVGLAVAAAAVPIPFSDAFTLLPIQIGMFAKIGSTYGMEISTTTITTIVSGAIGGSVATLAGRAIVTGLLKLIPVVGSAAGGIIASTTAGTLTKLLGYTYITVLNQFCEANPGKPIDTDNIMQEFKKMINSRKQ